MGADSGSDDRRRQRAIETAAALAEILAAEFGASRVVLFGSALDPGRFGERSDIDLAVEGLAPERHFEALGRLMMASPFAVDLEPIEAASDLLAERIREGRVLHGKREDSGAHRRARG